MLAAQHPGERHDGQREQAECGQRADPADRAGEQRRERRDDELAERAAGVDHAAREAALLGGQRSRDRRHQHPEPGHAGPARRDDADEQHQHPRGRGVRREHRAEHDEHGARGDHAAGPVLVGHRAGDRLRDAPHELRAGEREADRGDAEAATPFTETRPSAIRVSAARREDTPAWDRILQSLLHQALCYRRLVSFQEVR